MLSFLRKRPATPAKTTPKACAVVDRLEGRLYFAHLGHVVELPDAAANGAAGHEVVASTYTFADHRRSRLIVTSV